MKIGAVYPQTELGGDPEAIDAIGTAAESQGYDHLVMYDHVVGAARVERTPPLWEQGPYTDQHPFHDPFVSFGYLAGRTKRLEFATGVLILPQRQTVLVAKQATDVDLLSKGRLRLGVGTGWNYVEYDALGQDFSTRGKRMDEQIDFLRQLWKEPLVTFKGKFDRIDRANLNVRPKRQIPIYCGGFSEPAFRRAARLADGFIFAGKVGTALESWARIRTLLGEASRAVAGFGADYLMHEGHGRAFRDPAGTLDAARRWQDAGGTHVSVVTMGLGMTTARQHIDYLAEVRQKLSAL